ncbi:hypothetical protein F5B21DRAFT_477946 [Xylaria acuta]|nr:hypothetical protein F5B21DRAFT_477946 [Xylaria acuta]
MGPGWDVLHRVKEHIYRRHMQPKHQCNRCFQGFSSAADLAAHQRTSMPCELRDTHAPVAITPDQEAQLRSRAKSRPDATEAEKWQSMYRILFPEDTHIPSPYLDEPCGHCISTADSRLLNDYLDYQMQQLPLLVHRELAAIPGCEMSDDTCARIVGMLSRLTAKVHQDFQESQGAHSSQDSRTSTEKMPTPKLEESGCSATHSQSLIHSHVAVYDEWLSEDDDTLAAFFTLE